MTREPSSAATVAVRLARAYPSLSVYSACVLADDLCRIERAQRRHAERCCSGEDGGYVRVRSLGREDDNAGRPIVREHDPDAEERAGARIRRQAADWRLRFIEAADVDVAIGHDLPAVILEHDPRGCVLKLRLPGDAEPVPV